MILSSILQMKSFVAKKGYIHICQFEIFAIEAAEIMKKIKVRKLVTFLTITSKYTCIYII